MTVKKITSPPTIDQRIQDAPASRAQLLQELQDALRAGALGDALADQHTARGVITKRQRVVLGDGTVVERR